MPFNDEYVVAMICLNGHSVNAYSEAVPTDNSARCRRCGEPTITECPKCRSPIRGGPPQAMSVIHEGGPPRVLGFRFPAHCDHCGAAYPWTERRRAAIADIVDLAENLSEEERETLKATIGDIVVESPRTEPSIIRFKRIVGKVGAEIRAGLSRVLGDVVSEAVKRQIFGP